MTNIVRYHTTGKAVYGTYNEDCPAVHVGDMADELMAATVAAQLNAAARPAFDYMAEADATCSVVFRPHNVELDDIRQITKKVVAYAEDMNLIKKLLFRGKTRDELGFGEAHKPTVGNLIEGFVGEDQWAPGDIDILHGAIGVITEAGEVAEFLLEWINGKPFDKVNVMEEAGDLRWYIVRLLRGIGITDDMNDRANIDKLRGRLGETFDVFKDANRDLQSERGKLEDAFKAAAPAPLLDFDPDAVVRNPPVVGAMTEDAQPLVERDEATDNAIIREKEADALFEKYEQRPDVVKASDESGYFAKPRKSGDVSDMAHRIKSASNADLVKPVPSAGVRSGPIGDCEGMDC